MISTTTAVTEGAEMTKTKAQREHEAQVADDLAALENDRAEARRFFRWWLGGATLLTLIGNGADAVILGTAPTWVRIAVHLVPPLIALVAIHAVTVLARTGAVHRAEKMRLRDAGGTTTFAVASAAALALAAAVLSYAGLQGLAVASGMHGWLGAVFPLTIDLGIAVSSVALVVLRPASAADLRAARAAASVQVASGDAPAVQRADAPQADAPTAPSVRHPDTPVTAATPQRTVPRPAADVQQDSALATAAPTPAAEHRDAAERIVASGVTAKSADEVADVLAARDAGLSGRKIAESQGLNGRTVRRILEAADGLAYVDASEGVEADQPVQHRELALAAS